MKSLAALVLTLLTSAPAWAVTCADVEFDGASFTTCEVGADEDLRLFLHDAEGTPLGNFASVATHADGDLSFAMNAGMFHEDQRPVGLYIQDGEQLTPASDGGGYGNFGLLPNGIFCIGDDALRVGKRRLCCRRARLHPRHAIRSDAGDRWSAASKIHARQHLFKLRNGVGTSADGSRAVFAISNSYVSFHHFARLFRDHLGLPDALFLDGSVSRCTRPLWAARMVDFPWVRSWVWSTQVVDGSP